MRIMNLSIGYKDFFFLNKGTIVNSRRNFKKKVHSIRVDLQYHIYKHDDILISCALKYPKVLVQITYRSTVCTFVNLDMCQLYFET